MRIFVTPRAGLMVRDPSAPARGHLPAAGAWKEDSQAWRRLAAAGDVTIGTDGKASAAPDAKQAKR